MRIIRIKVTDAAKAVLERAIIEGNTLKITEQLDRKIYLEVNKVLEGIGGKWNRKVGAHVFPSDPNELLWKTLEDGKVEVRAIIDEKQTYQMFFTPPELADRMVAYADIQPGNEVLEPSAGTGAIVDAIRRRINHGSAITAVEIQPALAERLRTVDCLGAERVRCADFLSCDGDLGAFDRIVMNPPFHNGDDIKHIKHALHMLKPGGRLVAICGNGPRQNEALRPLASEWEELPTGTFKDQGTGVNAVLLTIDR